MVFFDSVMDIAHGLNVSNYDELWSRLLSYTIQ